MRYIAYAINNRTGDLMRVAVNQSSLEKAELDAMKHSVRHGKKNAGVGKAFTFHGSYTSKLLAQKKERQTPGSFIQEKDGRYYVLKPKKIRNNNPHGVQIYGRCLRIEAVKTNSHTYGGKSTVAGQKYYHDFSTKHAKIYGLPNGDLLISTR